MNANLVLLKKNGSHKAFALARHVTVIGRRDDCDLRIPLPMVSRRHCALSLNKDSMLLRDLGSRGGTYVNDQRVDDQTTVKAGDYLRIGPLIFVCQIDGKPEKIVPPPAKAAPPAAKAKPKPQPPKAGEGAPTPPAARRRKICPTSTSPTASSIWMNRTPIWKTSRTPDPAVDSIALSCHGERRRSHLPLARLRLFPLPLQGRALLRSRNDICVNRSATRGTEFHISGLADLRRIW